MTRPSGALAWALGVMAAALVAGVALTWPVFRYPAATVLDARSLYGDAESFIQRDINLTMWVLAWTSRALWHAPSEIFDTNAFFPDRGTLALSEHMLGITPLFAPVYWLTDNPVLAHQVALLATFAIAALGVFAYVAEVTGDRMTAAVAGLAFACAPYRVWQLGNLHVVAIHGLPFVLLGIERGLRAKRHGPLLLGVGLALSGLSSFYVGYAAFLGGAVYGAARVLGARHDWRTVGPLVVATLLAASVVALMGIPYLRLAGTGSLPAVDALNVESPAMRGVREAGPYGVLRFFILPVRIGVPMFVGWTMLALGLVAVRASRVAPVGGLAAVAAMGYVLACGPVLDLPGGGTVSLPYGWLASVLPGFGTMRVPQRFGALTTLAVVALAAIGLAYARRWLADRGHGFAARGMAVVVGLCALAETWPGRLEARVVPTGAHTPPEYRWLAEHGQGGALAEFPTGLEHPYLQSLAMFHSTQHWLPIANGYTSYPPPRFVTAMEAAAALPERGALDRFLATTPIRWALVRRGKLPRDTWPAWEATFEEAGFRRVQEFGGAVVWERLAGTDARPIGSRGEAGIAVPAGAASE